MKITKPETDIDYIKYYDLRWRTLRKPWNQPRGSERDELEDDAMHAMAVDGEEVVGVGRAHLNTGEVAQIRYMAVDEARRGEGIGTGILKHLEAEVAERGAKSIVLNARESAIEFYAKRGYKKIGKSHTLFGSIKHFKMRKVLNARWTN